MMYHQCEHDDKSTMNANLKKAKKYFHGDKVQVPLSRPAQCM